MESWKAQMQEKHLVMLGKINILAGIYLFYYPFSKLLEQATSSHVTTVLHIVLFGLFLYWMKKFLLVAAHNTTSSSSYTDEYTQAIFYRSCFWGFNAVMVYLCLLWFSNWWTFWLGVPSINTSGQLGFASGLLVQGASSSWWLYRDGQEISSPEQGE